MTQDLDGSLALRLRDAVRGDVERRFGDLCVTRGILSPADLQRGLDEQERLREDGEDASLVHALSRLGLVDGGPLWLLLDEVLAAPAEGPPGRRLGRYELIREVGKGGTGTVYKAYDTQLNRVVAVKTIRPDLAELAREAKTLAGLSHRNIVAVYDAGEIDGTPFLCMEYVEGSTLAELVRRGDRPTRELVGMIAKVAEAVAAAHARGVVHCDLKPGNILVDRDGEPRVIDFGLARVLRERQGRGAAVEGTPAYMAPEQVRREAGPPADVYALGVCLYEVLTGVRPFEAETTAVIFERLLARDFVPPRARRPDIPRAFERICLKAMEGDPAKRYASAADLARDLDRGLAGRRRIAPAWAVAAVLLIAATAGTAVVYRSWKAARLEVGMRPVEAMILETRPFFYIKEADVAGRLEKVRAALRDLDRVASDSPAARRVFGMGSYFVGDLPRSEEALRLAVEASPEDGAAHYYLGRLYLDRAIVELLTPPGRPDAERRERSKAWTEKAEGHLSRATTWEGAPELDRLVAAAGLAFAKGDGAAAIGRCREGLDRFAGKLGVEEFSRLLGILSPVAERAAHLTRAIEFRPHYPWALLQRGCHYLHEGKPDLAIEDFDRAIALYPEFVYAINDRGVAWFAKGDNDRALADFEKVIRLEPRNAFGWGNRALARGARKDLKGAIEDSTHAITLTPHPAIMYLNRGVHRQALGDFEGAMADAEEGLRLEPGTVRGYTLRGGLRGLKKDWAGAGADYEKALSMDPKNAEARAGRGIAKLNTGDRAGALRDLDKALRLQAAQPAAWFHRGSMKAEEGDLDGAIEDLSEALRHDPLHLAARISRGIAYESRGELAEAVEDYDQALRQEPRSYDALFNRGMARLAQGKPSAAVKDLEEALKLAPADWNSRGLAESTLQEARKQ